MASPKEIIITHSQADYDAFASLLCAQKLFPEAMPILPGTTIFRMKELKSLYRDVADFQTIRDLKKIKNIELDRVIIVDTKKARKLREFRDYLAMAKEKPIIFDHHPPTSDDLTEGRLIQFPFGANTTGLFFKLAEQSIELNPQEATIALIGIYADTGNLTYPGTTPEDAYAAGELLRLGGDLKTVNHYLRPYFNPGQRMLLRDMLADLDEMDIEGYKVVLIKQCLKEPMQGLSELLAIVSDMTGADAILGLFASEEKDGVQIIIQSHVPQFNAAALAARFNGGGHAGAAAGLMHGASLEDITGQMVELIKHMHLPGTKVREVMSKNVQTVSPHMPLSEVGEFLESKNIHGAPVVDENGNMVGIISLRDVVKARQRNLAHAQTSGFMSHKVISIGPDEPAVTAKKLISSNDIGRLPVLKNSKLVGIISRADILRSSGDDDSFTNEAEKSSSH